MGLKPIMIEVDTSDEESTQIALSSTEAIVVITLDKEHYSAEGGLSDASAELLAIAAASRLAKSSEPTTFPRSAVADILNAASSLDAPSDCDNCAPAKKAMCEDFRSALGGVDEPPTDSVPKEKE